MSNNVIGEKVREARLKLHPPLTQAELAAKVELEDWRISRVGIAKIEAGIRKVTDVEVVKLAKVLDVPVSWLFSKGL